MTREKLIAAMAIAGYDYDDINSYDGYLVFYYDYGKITFDNFESVENWLNNVVFDDDELSDRVEKYLHPERF